MMDAKKPEYPVDSKIVVTVTPDMMNAFLLITAPANGGRTVSYEDVAEELLRNGVRYNINEKLINEAINMKKYDMQIPVAKGRKPVDGTNGLILYHFSSKVDSTPRVDENGFVDYKDISFVRTVTKGTVIANIKLPTEGECGYDVRGVEVRQKPGVPAQFRVGSNTSLTPDRTQIVADEDGCLVFRRGGFDVDLSVVVNGNVDYSTGNVDFIGDVKIKGDVSEGFTVKSKKNIIIYGNAVNATLSAAGDITVKKGLINSTVNCKGTITADFCEHSVINCEGLFTSGNCVMSKVHCGELICKGELSGGDYESMSNITTETAGTKNYVRTHVSAGRLSILSRERVSLQHKLEDAERNIDELTHIIEFLNQMKKNEGKLSEEKELVLGTAVKSRIVKKSDAAKFTKRIADITAELGAAENVSIRIRRIVYPGVVANINDSVLKITDEHRYCVIKLGKDEKAALFTL
ncbi:MAG: DUF342 domain-containing protein [Oscillospiraceae bacterium]|nr:DUF342 domain-containing protein [Oscillospiraceae bacterium]